MPGKHAEMRRIIKLIGYNYGEKLHCTHHAPTLTDYME